MSTHKQNAEAFARSARQLIAALSDAHWSAVMSGKGPVAHEVSPALRKLTGTEPEIFLTLEDYLPLVHEDERDLYRENFQRLVSGELQQTTFEYRQRISDDYVWLNAAIGSSIEEDGTAFLFGALSNISSQREQTDKIEKAVERAEQDNTLKTSLLANLNHEFRTPLTSILGLTSIMEKSARDENLKLSVKRIREAAHRLMSSLSSIFEFTRLELMSDDTPRTNVSLLDELLPVLDEVQKSAFSRGVQLELKVETYTLNIYDKENLLSSILNTLLSYTLDIADSCLVECIIGSTEEDGQNYGIFTLRIHSLQTKPYHLSMPANAEQTVNMEDFPVVLARKMTEALGGKLITVPYLERGSQITAMLPTADPEEVSLYSEMPEETKEEAEPVRVDKDELPSILLVEDNEINRELTEFFVEDICQVESVETGLQAVELVKQRRFEAILMDINLGAGLDGVQATQAIREVAGYDDVPIVAVTGYAMPGDKEKLIAYGLSHYLPKPFQKEEIIGLLNKILGVPKN